MKRQNFLSDLLPGDSAVILGLPDGIPSLTRLKELGLLPGTKVHFIRRAPLGDPVEIMIRGALLSLRSTEAGQIEVEVAAP